MRFSERERAILLSVKGVGPKVVERLEEQGLGGFESLAQADPAVVCAGAAASVGSTCWKNSPQARKAVEAAVAVARSSLEAA
ncbi:helix-hairpin-helix domain-containing protein [Brevundimonas sp.]|uniref:helix-hairpin-helix domain-containing protein n=1 Tax=Brevundimonas sp. TaxID=1871086 RepID=UPI002EDAA0F3